MDAELLKKKFDRLYNTAFKLRHYQLRWQKYQIGADWANARRYANKLDKMLNSEEELKKSLLQELF